MKMLRACNFHHFGICLFVFCISLIPWSSSGPTVSAGPSGYHLLKTYKLGGGGSWDYLAMDSASRRLYISRGTHVLVIDADSGKVVGDIPDTDGVHGIALIPSLNRGFTSNGRAGNVTIFDLLTLQTVGHVATGQNPDAIVYDPASNHVFTFNGASKDATAIDPINAKVAATIPLDGKPEFAAADGANHVFVNLEDKSQMVRIDTDTLLARRHWAMSPCEEPTGLAIDREHRRLFAGCGNGKMVVMNAENGQVIATLPIGKGVDATAFDPDTDLVFASCGEGLLTVIHEDSPDKFSIVENVPTQRGARTMALDEKTHNVYVVTADFGTPPAPTPELPHPRPPIMPDTFVVLMFGK